MRTRRSSVSIEFVESSRVEWSLGVLSRQYHAGYLFV
jgi:hypothetical protein